MKGLIYQLKSVRKDKFCIMSFLLPIVVAIALNYIGSIDLSSLGEFHFGVVAHETTPELYTWLERYGSVTVYQTGEELIAEINEPSTNLIGVEVDGDNIKTMLSGDELDMFRQAADTLPTLYEQRGTAAQANIQVLEHPDIMAGYQNIFIAITLIVAMFMGCTFNAMNIISEKEDGVALINEILPNDIQTICASENFYRLCVWLFICYCHSGNLFPVAPCRGGGYAGADRVVGLCICLNRPICRQCFGWSDGGCGLYQNGNDRIHGGAYIILFGGNRK